ncbi:MAG: glycoside hydrolase family 31 protein [Planctomycetota bacterium]|nr:glycoside hydrolase family 31 protein [Planctomycetota bacterium]
MATFLLALATSAGSTLAADLYAEWLVPRTVVFHDGIDGKNKALPSLSLVTPRTGAQIDLAKATVLRPKFLVEGGKHIARVGVAPATSLYGTGEVAGPLLRNGKTVTLWNYDAYGYDQNTPHLYQSHPWVLGVNPDGSAFGVIADSTYRMTIELPSLAGGDMVFTTDSEVPFPIIVIERDSPQDVMKELARLTGTMPLPPKWSLGYHQCRYSYYPDTRVMEIAKGFRDRKIPCDVIWHDIDYMYKFLCFTFDPKTFPDPKRHNADLHALNFKTIWMIDPGIAADPKNFPEGGYKVFEELMAGNHATQKADGTPFYGDVWPGKCVFPDYMRKETRQWWATLYKDFMATGIDGVWNDMNEPAVFNTANNWKTMPLDNIHRADPELGGTGTHARYHNVYGMHMIKASREGILAANPDKRAFVLSRANFLGGHRYGATWTGDNSADWPHLEESIPMALNVGLSGQPNIGPDIGGFAGNGPAGKEGELFARWMGFGALLPFARGHTGKDNIDKEPWSFGPEVEAVCKAAIERRYRFMPTIYTAFREASVSGLPVARPLFFADPKDAALRSEDDAFLLGDNLLVAAQVSPAADRVIAMPLGNWREFNFGEKKSVHLPRLYCRPGGIIVTTEVQQFVDEKPNAANTLIINLDDKGMATGTLYEDAGDGWGYQKGDYLLTTYTAKRNGDQVNVYISAAEGKRERVHRNLNIRLLTADGEKTVTGTEGQEIVLKLK